LDINGRTMGLTKPRAAQIFNLDYKQSTRVVTTTNINLTGGAPSLVDGVSLSLGDRILVTAQNTGTQNGLYYVTTLGSGANGTWARTSDGNENGEIEAGMIVIATEGVIYADTQWKLITDDPIVIGSTALTFTQNYMANSISSGTSNVVVTANANVTISSAGTANVLTISSTGTVTSGTGSVTGNVTGGNIRTGGVVSATGIVYGSELTSTNSIGSEGGQLNLAQPASGSTLAGGITIDVYNNLLRFFEQGGTARGAYIDISAAGAGVSTNLLASSGGTPGGSNTYVQFNDGGAFGGNGQFVYNKVTNVLTVGGVSANSNGAGNNYAVGDDAYIGDINEIDTVGIKGSQSNGANAYIVFGNSDSTGKLGRAGTGPLTYAGAFSATGAIQTSFDATTVSPGLKVSGNVLSSASNIGIVQIGAPLPFSDTNIIQSVTANADTYVQMILQNQNSGTAASSDYIVNNDTVSGTTIYGDFGINSTTFASTSSPFSDANGTYLYGAGGNLSIGTLGPYTLKFGTNSALRATLDSTGILSVVGNIQAANILTAGTVSATGNVTSGNISATGNATVGNISATGNIQVNKQLQMANNNGGTTTVFYMQYNTANSSVDFIFV
jgi:hypothetical protein